MSCYCYEKYKHKLDSEKNYSCFKDKYANWRCYNMLNFKNSKGEIVMTEKDNGDLSIHDDVLKESLNEKVTLEEAKKKVQKEEE